MVLNVGRDRLPHPPKTVGKQILTLRFIRVAKLQLWSSSEDNFMVGGSPQEELHINGHSIRKFGNRCCRVWSLDPRPAWNQGKGTRCCPSLTSLPREQLVPLGRYRAVSNSLVASEWLPTKSLILFNTESTMQTWSRVPLDLLAHFTGHSRRSQEPLLQRAFSFCLNSACLSFPLDFSGF